MRFGGTGLRDWLVQRLTAVILAGYVLFWVGFFATHPAVDYTQWRALFAHPVLRAVSSVALISLIWHAWIGLWTLSTDYLNPFWVRFLFQVLVLASLLVEGGWGLMIVWGGL